MKKKLLAFLYSRNKAFFDALLVQDFLLNVPQEPMDQAINILAERKSKVERAFYFQAFWIQRRMVADAPKSEIYFGMLLQIKILLSLIGASKTPEEAQAYKEVSAGAKPSEELKKAMEGVDKFRAGKTSVETAA